MDQLKKLLASLSVTQRISIVVLALAAGAAILGWAHWKKEGDFRPLYSNMAPEDAGPVLEKIKETGTEFRLSENGTAVLVPSARVAELRLELAAAGLPKTGRIGFELFDKNTFGATDFVEHVNYGRALEGELERSVTSLAEVEQARIHITFPKDSVFLESRQPAKASVLVKLRPGGALSAQNVTAISHLVASAVEGLTPDAVSVLDMNGNLLSRPRMHGIRDTDMPDEILEWRRAIERDLVAKISSTLDPLLGAERFRAGASVDCDFTSGEQSEEILDPTKSVMVSSQTSEDVSGTAAASGIPGTASNLPRAQSRPSAPGTGVSHRTENTTYQSSRTVRRTRLPQGMIRKISLSVLVDNAVQWEGQGAARRRVLVPPTPDTLKVIHDLVAAATGFNSDRGDQLIIESLPFDATLHYEPPAPAPRPAAPVRSEPKPALDWLRRQGNLLAMGAVAVLLLALIGWAVARAVRRKPVPTVSAEKALPPGVVAAALNGPPERAGALPEAARPAGLAAAAAETGGAIPVEQVRQAIEKDASAALLVVRGWIEEPGV